LDKQDIKSDLTYYIMKIIYLFICLWNKGFKFFIIIIFSSLCTIKKWMFYQVNTYWQTSSKQIMIFIWLTLFVCLLYGL